jgi:hypothetical protein
MVANQLYAVAPNATALVLCGTRNTLIIQVIGMYFLQSIIISLPRMQLHVYISKTPYYNHVAQSTVLQ